MEQLSQCTTAIEPILKSLGAETTDAHQPWHSCCTTGEATTARSRHTTAREEQRKAQHSQKYIKLFLKKKYCPQIFILPF